jgi:hypothetical protein
MTIKKYQIDKLLVIVTKMLNRLTPMNTAAALIEKKLGWILIDR